MNQNSNAAETPKHGSNPAPIVDASKLPPVEKMTGAKISEASFALYVAKVAEGKPTKHDDGNPILPGRYSALRGQGVITAEMHAQVTKARGIYRTACTKLKTKARGILASKKTHLIGFKETARGGGLRYLREEFGKRGQFKNKQAMDAYIAGDLTPKAGK